MKIKIEVRLDSLSYYIKDKWIDITNDDLIKIMVSKFNTKKISATWKGMGFQIEAELETKMGDEIAKTVHDEISKRHHIPSKVIVISETYTSKDMSKIRKVITFDRVFK